MHSEIDMLHKSLYILWPIVSISLYIMMRTLKINKKPYIKKFITSFPAAISAIMAIYYPIHIKLFGYVFPFIETLFHIYGVIYVFFAIFFIMIIGIIVKKKNDISIFECFCAAQISSSLLSLWFLLFSIPSHLLLIVSGTISC